MIKFIFTHGLASIKGNEGEEYLARTATKTEGKLMNCTDILTALRDCTRMEDLRMHKAQSWSRM